MKKVITWLLLAALVLSLTACTQQPDATTTAANTTAAPTETTQAPPTTLPATQATEVIEPTVPVETTQPAQPVTYFKDYDYRYEGRDLAWEEDVVYMAQTYLGESYTKGHPLLVDKEVVTCKAHAEVTYTSYYDAQLCATFVAEINGLLDRIPELSDTQIAYELLRIVALLQDNHSNFFAPVEEFFPLKLEAFWSDAGAALHATQVPGAHEDLLYAQLISINGIAVEEVTSRLSKYVCCDYEENALWDLANTLRTCIYVSKDYLQQVGVVGLEEDTAMFTFMTAGGETVTIELPAVTSAEKKELNMVKGNWSAAGHVDTAHMNSVPFWHEVDAETNTLYIRFNDLSESTHYRFNTFISQLKDATNDGHLDKIIVDLRQNPGGKLYNAYYKFTKVLQEADAESIYVLINGSSYSCAFCYAYEIKMAVDKAVLVGSPVGQTMQFFGNPFFYTLPNSGLSFSVGTGVFDLQEGHDFSILEPDVYLYQTLEDYKNGVDTVLEAVLGEDPT